MLECSNATLDLYFDTLRHITIIRMMMTENVHVYSFAMYVGKSIVFMKE